MSLSKEDIEAESACKIIGQHECAENELAQLLPVFEVILEGDSQPQHWELFSIWQATEADVAGGEAAFVGEVLNLSSIKIRFCPFCGSALD